MPPKLTEFVIRIEEYCHNVGRIQIGLAVVLIKLLLTKIDTRFKVGRVHVSMCHGRVSGCRRCVGMVADRSDTELCTYE
jgi:hypothetical protein